MWAFMKNVSSLFARLTTSSSAATSASRKDEKSEKSEKQAEVTVKKRSEKNQNAASRSIQADPKPAAKSEKSGATGKPDKRERKEKKYPGIDDIQRTMLAAIDAEEERVNRLYTPVARTAMGATYEFKSEKEAMEAMPFLMMNATYFGPQAPKPYSSLSSATTTTTTASTRKSVASSRSHKSAEQIEAEVLKYIRSDCADSIHVDTWRHSLSMKEVRVLQRNLFSPGELNSALHALAQRGAILIDKENPEYVFRPVPPEIKAQDKTPRSTTSSSTSSDSTSESSAQAKMPDFFARMGRAERDFYERDSVAVLLHYLHEAPQYTSLRAKRPGNNMRDFSISRSVLEQAARNEDPGFGIHPYLIPKAIRLLEKECICQPHDVNAQELHFSGTIFQLDDLRRKYSYEA